MKKVAWAFPEDRIDELKSMWDAIGVEDSSNYSHFFITSQYELLAIEPEIVITNQYDWTIDYCLTSKKIRWVHFMSSGIDKALAVLKNKNEHFIITNVRGIHGECMKNYVMSWILAESQNLFHYYDSQKRRIWNRRRSTSLRDKVIMIYGYGSIGQAIGEFAMSSGMKVIGVKNGKHRISENNVNVITTSEAYSYLPTCDYFVSCLPLTDKTHKIFNLEFFEYFKSSPLFINVSRAETVNMTDLKIALNLGKIRGAVLDVHESEPLPESSDDWTFDSIYITPHIAGYTESGLQLGIEKLNRLLKDFISEGIPNHERVSITKGY